MENGYHIFDFTIEYLDFPAILTTLCPTSRSNSCAQRSQALGHNSFTTLIKTSFYKSKADYSFPKPWQLNSPKPNVRRQRYHIQDLQTERVLHLYGTWLVIGWVEAGTVRLVSTSSLELIEAGMKKGRGDTCKLTRPKIQFLKFT